MVGEQVLAARDAIINTANAAGKAIKESKFIELQREINRHRNLSKKGKLKLTQTIDGLLRIIKKYPLENINSIKNTKTETAPEIIISESYN